MKTDETTAHVEPPALPTRHVPRAPGVAMLGAWVWAEAILRAGPPRPLGDRGQATAEYALVVLGAAAVAMLLIAWATSTGKISTLLNKVVDSVAGRIA